MASRHKFSTKYITYYYIVNKIFIEEDNSRRTVQRNYSSARKRMVYVKFSTISSAISIQKINQGLQSWPQPPKAEVYKDIAIPQKEGQT